MSEACQWLWPADEGALPTDDRGLAYGDGVFETLRVTASGAVLLDAHRERLLRGCDALDIPFFREHWDDWRQRATALGLLQPDGSDRVLKVTVTRGSGGRGYKRPSPTVPRVLTTCHSAPPLPSAAVNLQLCRQSVHVAPHRAGLKTLERLDQVMASLELRGTAFEGLMPDASGYIAEGTRCNLILLQGKDELLTPPARTLAVRGTLRDWLLERSSDYGFYMHEGLVSLNAIRQAQGVALVNSVFGMVTAASLDEQRLNRSEALEKLAQRVNQQLGLSRDP